MRTAYRKPIMEYEKFVASDYVASCTKQAKYEFTCIGCGKSITSNATFAGENITEAKFKEIFGINDTEFNHIMVKALSSPANMSVYLVRDSNAFPNTSINEYGRCSQYKTIESQLKTSGYIVESSGDSLYDEYEAGGWGHHFDDNIVEYNAS